MPSSSDLSLHAVQPQAVGDVFVNGFRKRIGFLKHHADAFAQFDDIHVAAVNVLPGDFHLAFNPDAVDEVVHAVEAAEQRGFAAAGRPDERGHDFFPDEKGNVFQRLR